MLSLIETEVRLKAMLEVWRQTGKMLCMCPECGELMDPRDGKWLDGLPYCCLVESVVEDDVSDLF